VVPVTCRTEYLTARHHRSASASWIVMMVALVGLGGLNIAGVDGLLISAVVAGLLALSLFAAAYGRLG
jgi:L-cystine uptake protein TcyP (sodium:dicarboxylate symporter family)